MSDTEEKPEEEKPKQLVQLEQAKSARSTCKITSEKIDKDEWRVGMEAYTAGRVSVNWMKLVPFLQNCGVDVAAGRASKCKVTTHAFSKGETRFFCAIGTKSRSFLTLPAAHETLAPLIKQAGKDFKLTSFKGLEDLPEGPRAAFAEAFKVPKQQMAAFTKEHPIPEEEEPSAPKRKKAKVASPTKSPGSPGSPQAASQASPSKGTATPTSKAADAGKSTPASKTADAGKATPVGQAGPAAAAGASAGKAAAEAQPAAGSAPEAEQEGQDAVQGDAEGQSEAGAAKGTGRGKGARKGKAQVSKQVSEADAGAEAEAEDEPAAKPARKRGKGPGGKKQ